MAYNNRGFACKKKGDYGRAIADYREAVRLNPKFDLAYDNLAWVLATAPEEKFRNGRQAVEYATRACELPQGKKWVETLAVAHAEMGNFTEAVKWEQEYLDSNPGAADAEQARQRLRMFQAGKAYHEERESM
jgi:tetratricopeptide (TPR) repeat protein